MGFWTRLIRDQKSFPFDTFDPAQRVLPDPHEPFMGQLFTSSGIAVADPGVPIAELLRANANQLWKTQPNLRKVINFIARNVASTPLHIYERISDTDRARVTAGTLATTLGKPRPRVGPYRFWHAVLSDGLLYDRWAVLKSRGDDGSITLHQIPSWRLKLKVDRMREVTGAYMWVGDTLPPQVGTEDGWEQLDLDELILDHGFAPAKAGMSPVETLRELIAENAEATRWRRQVWENGARVPAWIERPPETQTARWSNEAREKFKHQFRDAYTGDGSEAGGVPLLEDGMQLHALEAFSPRDTKDLDGRQLNAIETASFFHIAPELIGAREGNYSNIAELRNSLYRDSLGPYITAWEQAIDTQLTPDADEGRALYVEAHLDAKLRGSFEEQAQVLQSSVGAPWLTRDEARARMNMPAIEGGDALIVPLNVLEGGQASPTDSGSQNRNALAPQLERAVKQGIAAGARVKADDAEQDDATHFQPPEDLRDAWRERFAATLVVFFGRQEDVVRSLLGSKSEHSWWDEGRWNTELADDLTALALAVAAEIGPQTAEKLGFDPETYDVVSMVAFLRATITTRAASINAATRHQIEQALEAEDPEAAFDSVWNVASGQRSGAAAGSLSAVVIAAVAIEAARQTAGYSATKTWVTGRNPRPSHAAMDGETVGLDEVFSNGAAWPGDEVLSVDELAGCNCSIAVNYAPEGG